MSILSPKKFTTQAAFLAATLFSFSEDALAQNVMSESSSNSQSATASSSRSISSGFSSSLGSAETLFNHYLPGCDFYFYFGLIGFLSVAYLILKSIFKHHSRMPKFLKDDPGLMSYTLVSGAVVVVLACIGVVGFYTHWGGKDFDTPLKRLTSPHFEGQVVAQIHASYQFWNFAMSVLRGEGWVNILHHLFCTYLGVINSNGFGSYHLIYMGGVAEISTIILTVMDIFKNNKYLQEKYPVANMFFRYSFCAVFVILRVFVWFVVLASFFSDIFVYLTQNLGEKYRLHCYMNVLAMLILSGIQLIWARLVVLGILKAFGIIKRPSQSPKVAQTAASSTQASSGRRSSSDSSECSDQLRKKKSESKKKK